MPLPVVLIVAAMLAAGALPLPYGYYTLLRIVACIAFAIAAFAHAGNNSPIWPWILGLLAVVFNPLIPIHLPKEAWIGIDLVAAALLLIQARMLKSSAREVD